MTVFSKVLNFFSLLDQNGRLSLTNTAVYVCLYKMATTQNASMMDIGTLLLVFANYVHKRYVASQASPEVDITPDSAADVAKQIEDLKSTVNALVLKAGMGR